MLDDLTLDRLGKLLGLLGSDHAGEQAAAATKANTLLRAHGLAWGDLVDLVRQGLAARLARPSPSSAPGFPVRSAPFEWQPSPERDGRLGFWTRMGDGTILGVRQCRAIPGYPPAWTANVAGRLVMGADGKPVFYSSAEDAQIGATVEALLV